MAGAIWVLAENWRGELTDAAFETLALGRELADGFGVGLTAVLMGSGVSPLADQLGAADAVILVESPASVDGELGAMSAALADLIAEHHPRAVLLALSNVSWDLVGLLPAVSGVPLVNSCLDVAVEDGDLEAKCLLYGGKMEVTVRPAGETAVFSILPGARPADAGRRDGSPPMDRISIELRDRAVRFVEYVEPDAGDIDITRQDVLVAVGRGLQGEANLDLAEELAELLGGVVCGSRPAIDQDWLPLSRQVGKSGLQVKPRLYLALGISGAPEHIEGMRDADLIIAVNTDPEAPIFRTADFGVEADLLDVASELIDLVQEAKEG